jgi:hypothetical protein
MPFMVVYGTSDGSPRYEQAEAIDEAALFVERLRNSEGIDNIRIFRMEEISFAFRPYYKVELGMPERQSPVAAADAAPVGAVEAPAPPVPTAPAEPGAHEADAADAAPAVEPVVPVSDVTPTPSAPDLGDDAAGAAGRRGLFGR